MTVTITQDVRDIAGVAATAYWYFSAPVLRENGNSIIDTPEVEVKPVDGVITVNLEPGLAKIRHNNVTYMITVPETDSNLWPLISSGVASSPSVSGAALDAAIAAYLEDNGGDGGDVVDDTTPQLGGDLDVNGYKIGDALPNDLTVLRSKAAALAVLAGTNTGDQDLSGYATIVALTAAISTAVGNLINGAPGALDTLKEFADAINDDAEFAAVVTSALATKQALSAALTSIAGLTPADNDVLQRKAGAWINRTIVQLKTDLSLSGSNTGDQDLSSYATTTAMTTAISTAVNALVNGAPGAMDTIKELADAMGDDPNFTATVTNALTLRVLTSRTVNGHALTSDVTVSKADVGLGNVDNVSEATILAAAAAAVPVILAPGTNYAEIVPAGLNIVPRLEIGTANVGLSSGAEHFTFFTSPKTETIVSIRDFIGGNPSASGTLARIGIYSVAANGDMALIGSTANLATLWDTAFAYVTRVLTSSVPVVAGTRYAVGKLFIGASSKPFFYSATVNGNEQIANPALCATLAAQTDLAVSTTLAALAVSTARFCCELLT